MPQPYSRIVKPGLHVFKPTQQGGKCMKIVVAGKITKSLNLLPEPGSHRFYLPKRVVWRVLPVLLLTIFLMLPASAWCAPDSGSGETAGSRSYQALHVVIDEFGTLTELQQENWNQQNQWKLWVNGTGQVSEVNQTNAFSEISDLPFEVTVELQNGDRAVLFYPKSQKETVLKLKMGDVLRFKGRLKKIQDWGLWKSGYIQIEG
jgi:hypothetical protein